MRKPILLLLVCIFLLVFVQAQITKGSILLGGGFSVVSTKNSATNFSEQTTIQYYFTPSFGLAVKENAVLGVFFNYSRNSDNQASKNKGYGGGFYYRRYMALGKSFYLFAHGELYYIYQESSNNSVDNSWVSKQNGAGINLFPGLTYAVSKRFHLEASISNIINLSYSNSKTETSTFGGTTSSAQKTFGLRTNLNVLSPFNFGFRFLLGKK